jgi:hypothetical protein
MSWTYSTHAGIEVQTFHSATYTRVHCLREQREEATTVNTNQNVANVRCGMDIMGIGYLFINKLTDFRFQKKESFQLFKRLQHTAATNKLFEK